MIRQCDAGECGLGHMYLRPLFVRILTVQNIHNNILFLVSKVGKWYSGEIKINFYLKILA